MKVVEGTNARSVANKEARNDCMKMVLFSISGKLCVGCYFKLNRNKDGPEHIGRKPWFWSKGRISVLHKFIYFGEIKIPKFIKDLPGG